MAPNEDACGDDDGTRSVMVRQREKFIKADLSGDDKLGFNEFVAMLPKRTQQQPLENLRRWFDLADVNDDGSISMNEFFIWSLGATIRQAGSGIEAAFRRCPLATATCFVHPCLTSTLISISNA